MVGFDTQVKQPPKIAEDELKKLYVEQGISARQIAKMKGCYTGDITKALDIYGIKKRNGRDYGEIAKQIVSDIGKGLSKSNIMNSIGISDKTFHNLCKRYNINISALDDSHPNLKDKEWLENIEVSGNVLFIAAGVFYYFEENTIKQFITRLIEAYPNSEILFDISSPLGVKIANKKVIESSGLDKKSHLIWGLEKKKDILTWDPRIKIKATYYYFRTLRIGLRNLMLGILSDFLGIQYMLHLKFSG